jgi:XTP/dITP diphosphohydrolase
VTRLVLLVTSPRVAAGLLSPAAWQAVCAGPVFAADPGSPLAAALTAAGIAVRTELATPSASADVLIDAARAAGTATWLVGPDGDEELTRAVADRAVAPAAGTGIEVELLRGSWDLPGARLLDVVATMDRLRSPGGCPWDAEQDHASLAPYLLEEAYEAFQAIEDADSQGLREELGDVLLQVAFHARLAEERPDGERWDIDEVATGLVDKLVRRHPHVFAATVVDGAEAVIVNWEAIKAVERGEDSVLASVPLAAPALTLAATLQRKAAKAGLAPGVGGTDPSLVAAAEQFERSPSVESAGALLWAAVTAMRAVDIDAEAALRAVARAFRDEIAAVEIAERPTVA